MAPEVVRRMAAAPRLAPWLHLPVQSGSPRLLQAMNRDYTLEQYLAAIDAAREAMPDLAVTTDLIVGFPGETADDFAQTLALVERMRYDTFYAFKYSPRSGTAAARREDDVTPEEKQRRLSILLEAQRRLSHEVNQAWVGRRVEVLLEGRDEKRGNGLARTGQNKIVVLPWRDTDAPGRFFDVVIERAEGQTLHGRFANGN
jgi:tRNA-2-methylthio-N6-dimethylallyladenosine synthase